MFTVGMFMPSVKLYQPKPNGKQLEGNLHKTRGELLSDPLLFKLTDQQQ